jgi:hypothetical protein
LDCTKLTDFSINHLQYNDVVIKDDISYHWNIPLPRDKWKIITLSYWETGVWKFLEKKNDLYTPQKSVRHYIPSKFAKLSKSLQYNIEDLKRNLKTWWNSLKS